MGSSSPIPQTPGEPQEPYGGEPMIMPFRPVADRAAAKSSALAADMPPIVLKLPDLFAAPADREPTAETGPARPWIGMVMWCVTGILGIVAVVLLMTGRSEPTPAVEEAPQWRGSATESQSASPAFTASAAGAPTAGMSGGGATGAIDVTVPPAAEGAGQSLPNDSPWRGPAYPGALGAPGGAVPPGGDANGGSPGYPGTSNAAPDNFTTPGSIPPGGFAPAGAVPGYGSPAGGNFPAGGSTPPAGGQSAPAGLGDGPWPPDAAATDQTKLQTNGPRTALLPNSGGAQFGGGIRNIDVGPRNDRSR